MGMPNHKKLYCPILKFLPESSSDMPFKEIKEKVVVEFNLSVAEENERHASGQKKLENEIGWALYGLKVAGLQDSPSSRGKYRITAKGENLRADDNKIIEEVERAVAEERKRREEKRKGDKEGSLETQEQQPTSPLADIADEKDDEKTPETRIEEAYQEYEDRLFKEVLETIAKMKWQDFERLMELLLKKMGYGEIEPRIKNSHDEGIDGIINQDALGLERVCIQAKRWKGNVGGPQIRDFAGALDQRGANKGVLVTKSNFTPDAKKAAEDISKGDKTLILIGGEELAELMIKYKVGVVPECTYEIKKVDENFFADVQWETTDPETAPLEETR